MNYYYLQGGEVGCGAEMLDATDVELASKNEQYARREDYETLEKENAALVEKVEGLEKIKTWCADCGEDVPLDEDLCCASCGNEATVDLDRVQHEHARAKTAEAELAEARDAVDRVYALLDALKKSEKRHQKANQ